MGKLRKLTKKIGRGIKKIGKKIGKAFKSVLKPFAKVFNKLGPLGSIAMMMILPGIGQMLAGFGSGWVATNIGAFAGKAVSFVGNAINFVATAPQKIFQTMTGAISNGWNALMGNPATSQGTWLSGTYTDTTGLIGNEAIQAEIANAAAQPKSWWQSFSNDMKNTWSNSGLEGANTAWDVSKAGESRLASFKTDFGTMKTDIADVFKKDPRKAMTEATAESTFGKNSTEFADFMKNSGNTDYVLDRTGVIGNIRDVVGGTTSKISDVTIPGVGDVGDLAWGGSTALSAYQTYAQFNPKDPDYSGAGDFGYLANNQLVDSGDQGGLFNTSSPTWSFDSSASAFQNSTNAQNTWNNNYGLPQGFNSRHSPGYGWTYDQWLQQQLAA